MQLFLLPSAAVFVALSSLLVGIATPTEATTDDIQQCARVRLLSQDGANATTTTPTMAPNMVTAGNEEDVLDDMSDLDFDDFG